MKIIKLFEEYVETKSIVNKLQMLITGYVKTIKDWFINGTFSTQEDVILHDIRYSENTSSTTKNIIIEFSDGVNYFQIIMTINMEDYNKEIGKYDKCSLEIKKYALDGEPEEGEAIQGMLLDQWDSSTTEEGILTLNQFTEEYILEIINRMDNENTHIGSNKEENDKLGDDADMGEDDDFMDDTLDEEGEEGEAQEETEEKIEEI